MLAQSAWRASDDRPRWVAEENLHITMRFIGSVPDEQVPQISAAIVSAIADHVDIEVRLGEAGAFPHPGKARVLWIGVDDPAGGLTAIAASLDERFAAIGLPPEGRAFRAHVTVARMKTPASVDPSVAPVVPTRFTVDRLTLFESHPGGGRQARYLAVSTYPFRRPLTAPRQDRDA